MDYVKRGILSHIKTGGGGGEITGRQKLKLGLARCRVLCRVGVCFSWGGGGGLRGRAKEKEEEDGRWRGLREQR